MPRPRVLVLRSPGSNCEWETAFAFESVGAEAEVVHLQALLEAPSRLDRVQIVCFPGGFSYGDDISAGQVAALRLKRFLPHEFADFVARDGLVLGICNGFQVLIKTGLLLPPDDQGFPATLTWNLNGRYTAQWVGLQVTSHRSPFLKGLTELYLPIAHAEGRFVTRDQATLHQLQQAEQLALKYIPTPEFDAGNPNGSMGDVAGVCDHSGRVFGLMPHPERCVAPTHHPRWTRENLTRVSGRAIFENAVQYFA